MLSLALPAHLAAAACTALLQNTILGAVTLLEDPVFAANLSKWQSIPGAAMPSDSQPSNRFGTHPASLRPNS